MELEDIQIKSDLGSFYLPTKKIVDLYHYLGDERKKNSDIKKSALEERMESMMSQRNEIKPFKRI